MTASNIFEEPSLEAPISFVMSSQDGPEDEPGEDMDDEDDDEEEMDDNEDMMIISDEEE